jgi:hypothetical protein
MDTGYILKCIDGEAEGQRLPIPQDQMKLVCSFLKAQVAFQIASATDAITYEQDQPVMVNYWKAQANLRESGFFPNKWFARSFWVLVETY